MTKLTPAQQVALARCTAEWQSAYRLQASIATLDALVKRGILQRHTDALGAMFSPRNANNYRLAAANEKPAQGKE
jgi:hypothetical protein